jgi:hypothetical protein
MVVATFAMKLKSDLIIIVVQIWIWYVFVNRDMYTCFHETWMKNCSNQSAETDPVRCWPNYKWIRSGISFSASLATELNALIVQPRPASTRDTWNIHTGGRRAKGLLGRVHSSQSISPRLHQSLRASVAITIRHVNSSYARRCFSQREIFQMPFLQKIYRVVLVLASCGLRITAARFVEERSRLVHRLVLVTSGFLNP